jgi:hypothetical protein
MLAADVEPSERPGRDDPRRGLIRSYLLMRAVVGVLGILIPMILVVGDIVFLEARMTARGSLSAYYHSGMRDVFMLSLAVISYWFAQRESKRGRLRDGRSSRRSAEFWRRFHLLMSGLIVGSILFIAGTQFFNVLDDNSLLLGESLAALAFGASWLAKGLELDFLLDRTPVPTPTIDPPAAL